MESNEQAEPRRKRLARERVESRVGSAVLALLMYNLAAGLLSGVTCHEIAKAAQTDNKKAREGYEFPVSLTAWLTSDIGKTYRHTL